jgi:hypothetical protein
MAFDDPKLPRATLRGEDLYVEGEQEPYFRDPEYTIWLRVHALTIHRGYQHEHRTGERTLTEFLCGTAILEKPDQFAVAGRETDPKTPIEFRLRLISDAETKFHWRATIGFQPYDWEYDWHDEFWVHGHCTRQYFDDILAAVRRGKVDHIRVGLETTMWTRDKPSRVAVSRTWHVAPPTKGQSIRPDMEQGSISSLTWEERFGAHPAKDTKNEPSTPKPQLVEFPVQVYSILSTLVLIGAALLILAFLRW